MSLLCSFLLFFLFFSSFLIYFSLVCALYSIMIMLSIFNAVFFLRFCHTYTYTQTHSLVLQTMNQFYFNFLCVEKTENCSLINLTSLISFPKSLHFSRDFILCEIYFDQFHLSYSPLNATARIMWHRFGIKKFFKEMYKNSYKWNQYASLNRFELILVQEQQSFAKY